MTTPKPETRSADGAQPSTPEDAVERQLRAYNARDVEAFVACYSIDVVVEDADGAVTMRGRDELRRAYGGLFERAPGLHATVGSRIRIGGWVVDEEHVTGRPAADLRAVAIYHLDDAGLIDRVRFLT